MDVLAVWSKTSTWACYQTDSQYSNEIFATSDENLYLIHTSSIDLHGHSDRNIKLKVFSSQVLAEFFSFFFLRSSIGRVVNATVFNSPATWAAVAEFKLCICGVEY